jgi:hypothetical protein
MPPGIGAVKATYATLRASLDGCRVGTVAAVSEIAPGIQIAANGSVLNNPVSVFASFDPTPVGPLRMPTYQAWTDVSLSNVPGIALDARFRTSVAVGGWTLTPKVQILGGITLGSNARIAVAGSCQLDVNGPRCDAAGSGAVSLYGFKLNMDLALQGLFTKNFLVSGSASARVAGVRVNVAGSFGTVGVTQGSTVDNPGLTYSFEASGKFPGFIVDGFSVKIEKTSTTFYMPTATFRASGTVGGVFAQVLGTSGRWSASAPFNPSMGSVTIPVSLTIPLGLASLPISLRLKLCLTGGCVGIAVPSVTVGFTFLKQRIDISDIPVDPSDWSFSYRLQRTVTRSGKAGDSWGGIKGTVSSSIDFSISNTSVSLRSLSASAKAYIGAFGSWNYVGTVGVEFRSGGEYCFTASGKKLCV